jgi:titin
VYTNQIYLTWQDNSDNEDGFKIERSVNGGGFNQLGIQGANVTTYYDSGPQGGGLKPGTYCYRVKAFNSLGDSSYSNESCATIQASPLNAPGNLIITG